MEFGWPEAGMEPVLVLHVVPELTPSGRDRGLFDLLQRLDRQVFDVRVAVVAPEIAAPVRAAFAAAGIPVLHHRIRQLAGPTPFARSLARSRALADMRKLFHETRPQIVHTHGTWMNVDAGLAARLAGVPHLMSHDHDVPSGSWHERLMARWAARLPEVIFVDSPRVAQARRALLGSGIERVLTLPLGVDLGRFQRPTHQQREAARRALGLGSDAYVVGTVGHLTPRKNVSTLIEAFRALAARDPEARLLVCGDGPEREPLIASTHELGLDKRIVWCGWRAELPPVYHALDVFVTLASERGGACRTLAEAMACGLPAVASNHARHVEIGGRHVLLVEPRPRAVAQALLELGRSAAWRHELGLEARSYAAGHLDFDVTVRLLEAAYAHCVARSPHPWSSRQTLPAQ
jgi:glycosyltransferase involved in cell wall biosynthesis